MLRRALSERASALVVTAVFASLALPHCLPPVHVDGGQAEPDVGDPPLDTEGVAGSGSVPAPNEPSGAADPNTGGLVTTNPAAVNTPEPGASPADSDAPAVALPLTLVEVQPSDSSIEVPLDAVTSITFSAPLDPTSVSLSAFEVIRSGTAAVAGSIAVDGNRVLFSPSEPLILANSYAVRFQGTLRSSSGATWTGSAEARFQTRTGAWSAPESLAVAGDNPRLAFDGAGNAVALWNQPPSSGQATVGMARFDLDGGWQALPAVNAGCGPGCSPKVVAGGQDSFALVWAATGSVTTRRYHPEQGLGEPDSVFARGTSAAAAAVSDGQLWMVADVPQGIAVSRMVDAVSWLPQTSPFATDSRDVHAGPVLVVDGPQNARVFWVEGSSLVFSTFTDGSWSALQSSPPRSDSHLATALTGAGVPAGNALLAWEEDLPSPSDPSVVTSSLRVYRVAPSGSLLERAPALPANATGNAVSPAATVNPSGDALLAWLLTPGNPDDRDAAATAWAAFRPWTSTTWSSTFALSTAADVRARPPAVGLDLSGNGHVIWVEADSAGSAQVLAARFLRESGVFGDASVISGESSVSALLTRGPQGGNDDCQLAVDAQGRALAIWADPVAGVSVARFE